MTSPRHLYLVDGSGFIFRAFHGLPAMTRADGTPVNAVYGFTTMLMRLLEETDADHLAVIFDAGRTSFRNDFYPQYKAHRPPPPEDLIPQFPLVRDVVRAFGLPAIQMDGFEADDLIATYARLGTQAGARVTIVSSDKDLMQLVGPNVDMFDPMKSRAIGRAEVVEKFGVEPDRVVDVQALCGDPTDNVPGVPGIGIKTAAQLIQDYGDLDSLLARAGEIKQPKRRESLINHADLARISRDLVRLKADVPVDVALDQLIRPQVDKTRLADFLGQMGFKSLLNKLGINPGGMAAPRADQPTVPVPPASVTANYELVTDLDRLNAWIADIHRCGFVAVDTETTGLDSQRAELVGLSLATRPGHACYIPVKHDCAPAQGSLLLGDAPPTGPQILKPHAVIAALAPLLADPAILKIGHNIKYDAHILARAGAPLSTFDDTMLMSYVLDGAAHGHGMDELALLHLDYRTIPFSQVCGTGKNQITFDKVPLDKALAYAAEDADITLRLHQILKPRLLEQRMLSVYETLDRPLVPVLESMERAGIRVDVQLLRDLSQDFGDRMADLESQCHALAGTHFNLASPQQLGKVLFEDLGLPGGKKTKTGQWGTGADILEDLAAAGHDLPARVLDWRQLAKLKSTYTDALIQQVNPATGRVHTSFAQTIAATGRLSSVDPNLQNIPIRTEDGRKIRHAFVAQAGHVLVSADYSQIELRLVAHMAGIRNLIDAFARGDDIHAITASDVFAVPLDQVDGSLRRRAKAINFGIIYGISAFGLAAQLGISNGEAKATIESYFARYPEIRRYMEETKETARTQGFVTTLWGRKVFLPGIKDKNGAIRAFAERAAINAPIQGTAADIIKKAMIRLPAALDQAGLPARLLLQVHDELVLEVPADQAKTCAALVAQVMEQAASLSVPLVAETGIGPSWGQAH